MQLFKQQGENRLSAENSVILFTDQQTGLYQLVKDYPHHLYKNNVLGITDVAKLFNVPVIITSSKEEGPNGPVFPEIKKAFPKAPYIARQGEINAWDCPEFVKAVKDTGRKKVVIHGIVTDVCVAFLALSMKEEGYDVYIATDVSGTFSKDVRDAAWSRMQQAGCILTNLFALACEYGRDWREAPEGFLELLRNYFPDYSALVSSKYGE